MNDKSTILLNAFDLSKWLFGSLSPQNAPSMDAFRMFLEMLTPIEHLADFVKNANPGEIFQTAKDAFNWLLTSNCTESATLRQKVFKGIGLSPISSVTESGGSIISVQTHELKSVSAVFEEREVIRQIYAEPTLYRRLGKSFCLR